jgi:CBS domain-containing protein
MDTLGVGCLVVVEKGGQPVGMVTDRDLALYVLRTRCDADAVQVADVMSEPPVTVTEAAPVAVAARFMRRHGVRRVPVVDDVGRLVGILAWDDLLQLISSELKAAAEAVHAQFPADLAGEHALSATARQE